MHSDGVNSCARSPEVCNSDKKISNNLWPCTNLTQRQGNRGPRVSSSLTLSPFLCLYLSLAHSCETPIDVICVDWKRTAGSPLHLHFRAARRCRGLHLTCQCTNENHPSLSLIATKQRGGKNILVRRLQIWITTMLYAGGRWIGIWDDGRRLRLLSRWRLWCL